MSRVLAFLLGLTLVALATIVPASQAVFSSTTGNAANSFAYAGVVNYLHNDPTPPVGDTDSQAVLPLGAEWTAPTGAVLYNYDQDRNSNAGLHLSISGGLGESDPSKYQIWSRKILGSALTLNGQATLTLWSSMKDFDIVKRGVLLAALLDCNGGGSVCVTIATGSLDFTPWNTAGPTWIERTLDFGAVNHTIAVGRTIRIKVVVGPLSDDDMWLAYDTSSYPSAFRIG